MGDYKKRTPLCDKIFSDELLQNKGMVFSIINSILYFDEVCINRFENQKIFL
jgi:hypothetical protein